MIVVFGLCVFFFKQKTAYEMRISDWSSDVCSSALFDNAVAHAHGDRLAEPGRPLQPQFADTRHAAPAIPEALKSGPCICQCGKHDLRMHDKDRKSVG